MTSPTLSDSEIRKLLSAVDSPRDRAIVVLFLSAGLFQSELIALDVTNIKWADKSIYIEGKRERTISLNPEALDALTQWHNARMKTPEPALFLTEKGKAKRLSERSVDHIIRSYGIAAQLDHPVNANLLRQTCIVRLLSKTQLTDKQAAALLGLDRETIDRYRSSLKEDVVSQPVPQNPLDVLDSRSQFSKVVSNFFPTDLPEDPISSESVRINPDQISVGREKIIAKILRDLEGGKSILLTGPLGIGKSHVLNMVADQYPTCIKLSSPSPIKAMLLAIVEKVSPGVCSSRTSAQEILQCVQSAVSLNPPLLIIDNLHRLKAPDLDILVPLADQFIILGATDDAAERLNSLWWKLNHIELDRLTLEQSKELIEQLTQSHSIDNREMLDTRIIGIAGGLPLSIVEMVSQLSAEKVITANQIRELYHEAGVQYRDWSWLFMVVWGVLVLSRFVALGTHSFEGYILAGMGLSVFMVLKVFVKLKR